MPQASRTAPVRSNGARRRTGGVPRRCARNGTQAKAIKTSGTRNQYTPGQPCAATAAPPISGATKPASAPMPAKAESAQVRRLSAKSAVASAGAHESVSATATPCRTRAARSQA